MTRLLTFQTSTGVMNIAVDESQLRERSGLTDEPVEKGIDFGSAYPRFSEVFDDLRVYADAIAKKLSEISSRPSEIEVSVGVTIKAEGTLIFVKGGTDADMSLKLTWRNPQAATDNIAR
jgi:hypothetical protein